MVKPIKPGPGQESVWDYPRPPRLESWPETVRVEFGGEVIASSDHSLRMLETSHPPVFYIPPKDVKLDYLVPSGSGSTFCEWKGMAKYYDIVVNDRVAATAAWAYPQPVAKYAGLRGYLAFYSNRVDACFVGKEQVQPQEGDFYGGWITSMIVGPFKGAPGTRGW